MHRSISVHRHCPVSALVVASLFCAATALAQETTVVALSGDPAPDGNGVIETFLADSFPGAIGSGPTFNDAGQAVFPLYLSGTSGGENDDSGLFFYDGEKLVQLARAGQASPDGDGTFNHFNNVELPPALNNQGVVAFLTFLTGTTSGNFESGIFTITPGGEPLAAFARAGDPSPDGDGDIQFVDSPYLADSGGISFGGTLTDPDPIGKRGVFRGDLATGALSLLARQDDPAPDGDGIFSSVTAFGQNDSSQMIFRAAIRNSSFGKGDGALYRVAADGTFTRILRLGDPSPDSEEVFLGGYPSPTPNASGQIAIFASLAPTVGISESSEGIYRFDGGPLVPVARTEYPGEIDGMFIGFSPQVQINDSGQIAFDGVVDRGGGQPGFGIYRADADRIVEIAYRDGVNVQTFTNSDDIAYMNQQGQIAVFTTVDDVPGLYFFDDAVGLMQVARVGQSLAGGTINAFRFTGSLNNRGQVAYEFGLSDGRSGLAIWSFPEHEFILRNGFD